MKYRFEYRIGRSAWYSEEQWNNTPGRTTAEVGRNLYKTEPAGWLYNVYAAIVDDDGKVVKISKHPAELIQHESLEAMQKEIALHAQAANLPVFNRDDFNSWDYFIINSDDISEGIVRQAIEELDSGEG